MDWLFNPGKLFDLFLNWIATGILNSCDGIFGAIESVLLKSPDVTGLPQVQALTGRSVLVVDTVFVLAFIAAGVMTMTGGGSERAHYTAKDLMSRRSEEHTSELQSPCNLVCRPLLEKKKT